ncbi:MAG: TolC family protein [Gammaproteobacteria bacterium]|nr:TolC family protein [Gammaproteobacteria bacterium]
MLIVCSFNVLAENAEETDAIDAVSDLSLKDIVEAALQKDLRLKRTENFRAQGQSYSAMSQRLYSGPASIALHHQNDAVTNGPGLREWEANLEVPLWRMKQRSAAGAVGSSYTDYAEHYKAYIQLQVAGAVRQAIWDLVLAEQRVKLAEQALNDANKLVREVDLRVKAGDLSQNERLLAKEDALAKEYVLVAARIETVYAGEKYEALTGLSERPVNIQEAISKQVKIPENHPYLREINARIAQAQSQLALLKHSRGQATMLTLGARNEKAAASEADITSIGIGIILPFDTTVFQQPAIANAEATISELLSERTKLKRQLKLDHHKAEHELDSAHLQSEIADRKNNVVQESLQKIHAAFKAGELDLNELILAQARAQTASRQLQLRQLEEQRAIANFNQTLGELP